MHAQDNKIKLETHDTADGSNLDICRPYLNTYILLVLKLVYS